MSHAARVRAQRFAPARRGSGAPVEIHHYDPVREIACRQLGIGYGELYVRYAGSDARSHEMASSRDSRIFIGRDVAYNDRQERTKYRGFRHGPPAATPAPTHGAQTSE